MRHARHLLPNLILPPQRAARPDGRLAGARAPCPPRPVLRTLAQRWSVTDRGGADLGTTSYWVCDPRQVPTVGSAGHPWEKELQWESKVPLPGCGQCPPDGACSSPLAVLLRDATPIPDQACAFKGCHAETNSVRTGTSMTGETGPRPAFQIRAHTTCQDTCPAFHTRTHTHHETRTHEHLDLESTKSRFGYVKQVR